MSPTRVTKRGPARKSRRRRLHISMGDFQARFNPEPDDWSRIEHSYGHALTFCQRERVTIICADYTRVVQSEKSAPFLDDVTQYLKLYENKVSQLWDWLDAQASLDTDRAVFFANCSIARYFENYNGNQYSGTIDTFDVTLRRLAMCAAFAKQEFEESAKNGFEDGQSWRWLIGLLTSFAKRNKMPAAAAKGTDKARGDSPSPFVAFVRELQLTMPEEARRHLASNAALAQAVSVARREFEADKRKLRVNRAPPSISRPTPG